MTTPPIVGVDLGGTNSRAGLVRNGQLADVHSIPISSHGSTEQVLDEIFGLIDQVMAPDVAGIGIGVPGPVVLPEGMVFDLVNIPAWKEVPLKTILEARYSVPALVNNDANCYALGETHFGKGAGHHTVAGVIMGTGFAAGLVVGGHLYTGSNCGAGEFGMIPYRDSIYEYHCAGQFFSRRTGQTAAEVHRRAVEGDPEAMQLFSEFGHHVGEGLKTIVYAWDPEIIVLGGSVPKAFPLFRNTMRESLHSFVYTRSIDALTIEVSELPHAGVLGAAALHFERETTAG